MSEYSLTVDSPWYLLLLLVLPVMWAWSYKSLAGLGKFRRIVALGWRSLVLLLLIFAVSDMRLVRDSDRLTVIYLLDQSASISRDQRTAMVDYTRRAVEHHRDATRHDRAAVIVFGRRPDIEIGPIDGELPLAPTIESDVDGEFTDLEAAMTMALALFPEDAAKRVVIITDGNENLGDALAQARNMSTGGVGIDVVPIRIGARADVSVEKITIPADVRQGQPFDLHAVLNNNSQATADNDGTVHGKLIIKRKTGDSEIVLSESPVSLPPGKTVISTDKNSPETIRKADFYTYEAEFVPDDVADDAQSRNNRATAYTHVRGRGQVLLIEDWQTPGQFDHLVETLKKERLEVTRQSSDQLFANLAELQRYDTVILANVPRSGGDDQDGVHSFSDDQISALVRNTDQMGAGLVMLGGANSFGAGGWTNTEIEKAMPVDFQIDNAKIQPVGALCLIMHAGEMADGNHWQQVVAKESIKSLGGHDYCGLLHWNGQDAWLWGNGFVKVRGNRGRMLARVDRMTPGDMPEFDPAMKKAAIAFSNLKDAAVKHMIIISDGDPTPATNATFRLLGDQKPPVMVTTVAVGSHGWLGHSEMKRIAKKTGGKYYVVQNAKALPKIYQREVRRLARPLVFERAEGFTPIIRPGHEIVDGIEQPPPITGFVLTTRKDSPLVEVSMVSPRPSGDKNNTILASWTYGLGRTVAFTTDTGETTQGWANQWRQWDDYKKLFSKIVRWSMRPVDEAGNFLVATDVADGKVKVMINAWDKEDDYLDFLNMTGTVVGPDMKPRQIQIQQVAPGRYIGEFDAQDTGSYMIMVNPGRGGAPIRTGINVPYSSEYRDREANLSLLDEIVKLDAVGGAAGMMIEDEEHALNSDEMVTTFNSFRHDLAKATSRQDIWPLLLLLGGCFFFFDVFFRRVHVSFAWIQPLYANIRDGLMGNDKAPEVDVTMARLRSRKEQVTGQIEQRRAAARFEPTANAELPEEAGDAALDAGPKSTQAAGEMAPEKEVEEDSYTSRLLKAKKDALRDRGKS